MKQTLSTTKANLLRQQAHSFHLFLSYYIFIHLVSTCHHVMRKTKSPNFNAHMILYYTKQSWNFHTRQIHSRSELEQANATIWLRKNTEGDYSDIGNSSAYNEACSVRVTIFSTGGEILTNFKLYGVARSYSSHLASLPGSPHPGEGRAWEWDYKPPILMHSW